jgi:hypothetical protein
MRQSKREPETNVNKGYKEVARPVATGRTTAQMQMDEKVTVAPIDTGTKTSESGIFHAAAAEEFDHAETFFLESTFIDQNNPTRPRAGPSMGLPEIGPIIHAETADRTAVADGEEEQRERAKTTSA